MQPAGQRTLATPDVDAGRLVDTRGTGSAAPRPPPHLASSIPCRRAAATLIRVAGVAPAPGHAHRPLTGRRLAAPAATGADVLLLHAYIKKDCSGGRRVMYCICHHRLIFLVVALHKINLSPRLRAHFGGTGFEFKFRTQI